MPKQIVTFKWDFEIKHNNLQNAAIMFEWFTGTSSIERIDTGLVEAWAPKSPDSIALFTELAPNVLYWEKVYDPIRVEEETAKQLCNRKFFVYIVNTDDMKVKWELNLDLSSLLVDKDQPQVTFFSLHKVIYINKKLPILEIEEFQLRISADKPLLQQTFKEYLNPLQINVIGVKGLPSPVKNYEPVYVAYEFFDGVKVETSAQQHDRQIRWESKHVHLLGHLDQVKLKEKLATQIFKVQVHDCDEMLDTSLRKEEGLLDIEAWLKAEAEKNKPPEPLEAPDPKKKGGKEVKKEPPKKEAPKKEAKKKDVKIGEPVKEAQPKREYNRNNYGIAAFMLTDLLKTHMRSVKLQSAVVPRKQYEDLESKNLDLNTTAKQNIQKLFLSQGYMENNCFVLVSFDMAVGIGCFQKPKVVLPPVETDKKGAKQPAAQQPQQTVQQVDPVLELPPIFERAVYIMPYKDREFVQKLQAIFYEINMNCFPQQGGIRGLTTKALNDVEKKSRELDYIGGFEVLDNEFRIFVLEGLSNGGMKKLQEALPRTDPNNDTFKILKNSEIKFKERIYTDFNVEIKRIRLRENLNKLLMRPDLYIRTKVPENIQDTLVKISNILRQWNLRTLAQFNLFPIAQDLIAVERKYSDSLTEEDVTGKEQKNVSPKQRKINTDNTLTDSKTINTSVKINQQLSPSSNQQAIGNEILIQQMTPEKQLQTFSIKRQNQSNDQYTLQMKTYRQASGSAGMYSGQTNNDYVEQMRKLRERARNDPNNFYTYSKEYLSLSIDPYDVEEELKKQREKQIDPNKPKFKSVIPRSKEEFARQSKQLPQCVIDDLKQEKYHENLKIKEEISKPTKQLKAFPKGEKQEFNQYIGKIDYFSLPQITEAEKITRISSVKQLAAEKEKQMREEKQKQNEEFLKKCLGATYFYTKSRVFEKSDQMDKYKGMLEDQAVKKGLMVTNTQIKSSQINLTRRVEQPPSTIFTDEPYKEPIDLFTRKLDLTKVVSDKAFDTALEPDVLTKSKVYKPLRQVPY